MSIIGDLIEDDYSERLADLATHTVTLRNENTELRLQRNRYRAQAERLRARLAEVDRG